MSSFLIVVAALHLSAGGGPAPSKWRPSHSIIWKGAKRAEKCRLKTITAEPGSYAAYACYDIATSYGSMGVIAYRTRDGLKIHEGIKPTLKRLPEHHIVFALPFAVA